jgi:hypothetical protein
MTTPKKKPTRGEQYAAAVRDAFDLNASEDILVDEISRTLDVLDGELSVTEQRQQRTTLARLVALLNLPEADAEERQRQTSRKAARAARVRWNREGVA